jgi:predicted Rossmann fold flavoprotein
MKENFTTLWDVIVIGGGPAGMMAAGRAGERGEKVLILEKNRKLGKKLLITGGGRCNVTNAESDTRVLLAKFKGNDQFLFSPFSKWSVVDTLRFFNSRGMPTKVEAEQRVFPVSNSAQSVWNVLVDYLKQSHVTVRSNVSVVSCIVEDSKITGVTITTGEKIYAKSVILATGGKSHPETGSTGDGFVWLKKLGHTIIEQNASLVPVAINEQWAKDLQGLTISSAGVSVLLDGKKQKITQKILHKNTKGTSVIIGKVLFTHFGVSGPSILNISRDIGEFLQYGKVVISLDLFPDIDMHALDKKVTELFHTETNKKLKNCLSKIIPNRLVGTVLALAQVDGELFANSVSRPMRLKLVATMKQMDMSVSGLLGVNKAIITSGGIVLSEVDTKTMASKLYPNLYVVGDVLNIDRPSGGYGLQLCWTTGFVAGDNA